MHPQAPQFNIQVHYKTHSINLLFHSQLFTTINRKDTKELLLFLKINLYVCFKVIFTDERENTFP